MVDFRYAARGFDEFRLGPLLRGEIDPARIRDRVVIVGVTADSLPDFFHVPVASGLSVGKTWNGVEPQAIHGVELHGHFTSQLIRFGLGESRPLGVISNAQEALLVLLAAALGCALARLGSSGALVVALLVRRRRRTDLRGRRDRVPIRCMGAAGRTRHAPGSRRSVCWSRGRRARSARSARR